MNDSILSSGTPRSKRKTKIIATIGPASKSPERLGELMQAGVNVFRLNFSHGSHEEHLQSLLNIRKVASKLGCIVAVLQDLSGPKIRISNVEGDFVVLTDGSSIELRAAQKDQLSNASIIYVESLNPSDILQPGHLVLLADGMISLKAEELTATGVRCTTVRGGRMRSRVGIAFPDSVVNIPATTEKDIKDLAWSIENNLDYVAVSFVKNAQDLIKLRKIIGEKHSGLKLIAKIERKAALENIHEIMDAADGVMVARGDLGLELPLEQVPMIQKRLIEQSNYRGIPVIVATQMLHSMVSSARPTRAEVSDIATAVMTGADALMLSEETAIGENPIEAAKYLGRIAAEAEQSFVFNEYKLRLRDSDRATVPDALAYAAAAAAIKVNAEAIIACTQTGNSARLLAKYRPQQPLYGVSTQEQTLRRMCLYWGINPIFSLPTSNHIDELEVALEAVQKREKLPDGSKAVITGGMSVSTPGSTCILEVREIRTIK